MNIFHTVILSIVEGITEFLPVSSTGHLILTSKLLGIPETEFVKTFEIFIQLGAIMAVVSLYFKKIMQKPQLLRPIIIAFIPTGILGLIFYKIIKTYLLGNDMIVVVSLAVVGLLLILIESWWKKHPAKTHKTMETLTVPQLVIVGLFQSVAMIPGVSRSASTIIGGMFMGMPRVEAVEFSFLLAVPTMAAATGLDLLKSIHVLTHGNLLLLAVGFIVSWIVAAFVIKAFIQFVKHKTFIGFGAYRIIAAAVYWFVTKG